MECLDTCDRLTSVKCLKNEFIAYFIPHNEIFNKFNSLHSQSLLFQEKQNFLNLIREREETYLKANQFLDARFAEFHNDDDKMLLKYYMTQILDNKDSIVYNNREVPLDRIDFMSAIKGKQHTDSTHDIDSILKQNRDKNKKKVHTRSRSQNKPIDSKLKEEFQQLSNF